jgi:hypothetical protein
VCAPTLTHGATNPVTGNPNFVTLSESQEINTGRNEDKKYASSPALITILPCKTMSTTSANASPSTA